jgi:hypothetical protein
MSATYYSIVLHYSMDGCGRFDIRVDIKWHRIELDGGWKYANIIYLYDPSTDCCRGVTDLTCSWGAHVPPRATVTRLLSQYTFVHLIDDQAIWCSESSHTCYSNKTAAIAAQLLELSSSLWKFWYFQILQRTTRSHDSICWLGWPCTSPSFLVKNCIYVALFFGIKRRSTYIYCIGRCHL